MPSLPFRAAPLAVLGHAARLSARRHVSRAAPAAGTACRKGRRSSSPICSGSAPASWACIASTCAASGASCSSRSSCVILHTTDVIRDRREDVSRTRAALEQRDVRAGPREDPGRRRRRRRRCSERLPRPRPQRQGASPSSRRRKADLTRWYGYSRWLAILMAAMLVGRRRAAARAGAPAQVREAAERANAPPEIVVPDVPRDRHARRPDAAHRTRASPTRSNGSTSAPASSSPIGR